MIKCQHSFFIVQKIYNKLETDEQKNVLGALLQKNLCYVNDKLIKSKCLAIIKPKG
jgi:hypothetical protein